MSHMALLPPDAVTLKEGHPITTSLRIAQAFGKRHNDLLRAITGLDCSPEFAARNFARGDYLDKNRQPRPLFEIRRDGVMLLIMGFTGAKAAGMKEAFIARFNAMEQALSQTAGQTPTAALTKTIDLARYTELLEAENTLLRERAAPKAAAHLSDAQCAALLNQICDAEVPHG